ncbi:MAG: peptidase T [Coriobacteriales bacterium]|nr:peptidase T [Coriobacteriales bacterium]
MPQYSDVVERFLRYARTDSQGDPLNETQVPSTQCQFNMTYLLAEELAEVGALDITTTGHAYVTAHVPASEGAEDLPTLALNAHIDTEASVPGNGVKPQVVTYTGGKLVMGVVNDREVFTDPTINPELNDMVGEQIICTDGSTLLGADDKAGVAEIMALLERIHKDPSIAHPRLAISFVPDEEIGHGASLLDLKEHGATWGYTLDGGPLGVMNYETFNAAQARVHFAGFSVHPGTAKNRMVNAIDIACEFNSLMPGAAKPQYTDGYEGYILLHRQQGNVEEADSLYILRDHDAQKFAAKKDLVLEAAKYINLKYGKEVVSVEILDEYRNMAEVVTKHPHLIENARKAYKDNGVEMWTEPMRGGTDGAQLCFRGLPCANISAGYHNAHGVKEFVGVRELETMVDVLQSLVGLYAQPQNEA